MALQLQKIDQWFQSTVTDYLDPRSEDWWLCFSIWVPIAIVSTYLLLVLKLGPQFMAKRDAYKVESVVVVYNVVQVIACFWVFFEGCREWIRQGYSFTCQPVDKAVNEDTERIARLVYTYYVIKISDLLDTIFFVLRKKFNQASFLHIYHHSGMVFTGYLACRFSLNGHFISIGILNSFVHVVMYSYYLYTALYPKTRVPLSIKKSLTTLQLVQFCLFAVHMALPLLQPSCRVQKFWAFNLYFQCMVMITLFMDFYQKAYLNPTKNKAA